MSYLERLFFKNTEINDKSALDEKKKVYLSLYEILNLKYE